MTKDHYKASIASNLANAALNKIIDDYADLAVQHDELKAKVVELEAKLNPKPESTPEPA